MLPLLVLFAAVVAYEIYEKSKVVRTHPYADLFAKYGLYQVLPSSNQPGVFALFAPFGVPSGGGAADPAQVFPVWYAARAASGVAVYFIDKGTAGGILYTAPATPPSNAELVTQ